MTITLAHSLPVENVKRRLENKLTAIVEIYRGEITHSDMVWRGLACDFSFSARGIKVSGSIHIEPKNCKVSMRIPIILLGFSGRIKEIIEKEGKNILDEEKI